MNNRKTSSKVKRLKITMYLLFFKIKTSFPLIPSERNLTSLYIYKKNRIEKTSITENVFV